MLIVFLEGRDTGVGRERALMPVAALKEGEGNRQAMIATQLRCQLDGSSMAG